MHNKKLATIIEHIKSQLATGMVLDVEEAQDGPCLLVDAETY